MKDVDIEEQLKEEVTDGQMPVSKEEDKVVRWEEIHAWTEEKRCKSMW
jgi:hypothetical protein